MDTSVAVFHKGSFSRGHLADDYLHFLTRHRRNQTGSKFRRSDVPEEETCPSQPIPLKPPALVRQAINKADLTNITPEAHDSALQDFRNYRRVSIYTPPTVQGTVTMPSHLRGVQWHGGPWIRSRNVLYVNVNEIPTINRLRPVYGRRYACRR